MEKHNIQIRGAPGSDQKKVNGILLCSVADPESEAVFLNFDRQRNGFVRIDSRSIGNKGLNSKLGSYSMPGNYSSPHSKFKNATSGMN